ncbi:MAG: phosphohistidine phosphatase SixA [Magnetovibrio sp.]|nr:phosphohistidine phosphatase SixA [Magnetovibrio sp.]
MLRYASTMLLYIARHGLAMPKDKHPDCPLSEFGRRDIARIASFLARTRPTIKRIIHSGKTRAAQTALIYAEILGPGKVVEEAAESLGPNDPTEPLVNFINSWQEDTMVVSHLPLVSKLLAHLAVGDTYQDLLDFQTGSIVCLKKPNGSNNWVIDWAISPELLGG